MNCGIESGFFGGRFLVAPVALPFRNNFLCLAAPVGSEGLSEIHLFLGELSLDGSVRPVRGALSAALAAREFGLKAIAVPEANAKEAAVVDGVDVFALKSLPQAVDLVNSPESFTPVKVDARQMLSDANDGTPEQIEARRSIAHNEIRIRASRGQQ